MLSSTHRTLRSILSLALLLTLVVTSSGVLEAGLKSLPPILGRQPADDLVDPGRDDGEGRLPPGPGGKKTPEVPSPCPEADGQVDFLVSDVGIAVGEQPYDLELADLDGDGNLDAVATSSLEELLVVVLRRDAGTEVYEHDTQGEPKGVAVGDFFGDGVQRVVVARKDDTVVMFSPQGGWNRVKRKTYTTGDYPTRIAAGDLNGDGRDDFVTVNRFSDTITIKRSTGDFGYQTVHYPSGDSEDIELADMDNDGNLDVVYPSGESNATVKYRLNNGVGAFGPAITIDMGSTGVHNFLDIATGDFNKDGRPDVVGVRNTHQVVLVCSDGVGTYHAPVIKETNYDPTRAAVADFDVDGNLDFALAHATSDGVDVFLGDGAGGLLGPIHHEDLDVRPWALEAADLNGDELPDLAVLIGSELFYMTNAAPCADLPDSPAKNPQLPRARRTSFVRGDVNASGTIELTDGLRITEWLFLGAETPSCRRAADVDGDDEVTISDISRLLNYLFLGGSQPVAPFPTCGTGKSETMLDCESYEACKS